MFDLMNFSSPSIFDYYLVSWFYVSYIIMEDNTNNKSFLSASPPEVWKKGQVNCIIIKLLHLADNKIEF